MKKQKGFNLTDFMIVIALIGALASVIMDRKINISPGNGEKVGQIVLLDHRGLFNQTWEGQLIRGGVTNGSEAFGMTPFNFTIEEPSLQAKVDQYRKGNTEVNITYRIEGICKPTRSESKCTFLTGIEPVKK